MSRDFEWPEFAFLLAGLRWTVVLALVSFVLGSAAGLLIALAVITYVPAISLWLPRLIGLD